MTPSSLHLMMMRIRLVMIQLTLTWLQLLALMFTKDPLTMKQTFREETLGISLIRRHVFQDRMLGLSARGQPLTTLRMHLAPTPTHQYLSMGS